MGLFDSAEMNNMLGSLKSMGENLSPKSSKAESITDFEFSFTDLNENLQFLTKLCTRIETLKKQEFLDWYQKQEYDAALSKFDMGLSICQNIDKDNSTLQYLISRRDLWRKGVLDDTIKQPQPQNEDPLETPILHKVKTTTRDTVLMVLGIIVGLVLLIMVLHW